jgi:2-polyprenyl-3-methyl-5-hydroxy-6-metoxy-1,4-benzoquinol methylase
MCKAPPNGDVLDIGCGDGTVARFMLREGASRVVAFDISNRSIKFAKSGNPGPEYVAGDAEDSRFLEGLGR